MGILALHAATGQTAYAHLTSGLDAKVGNGSSLEIWNQAHWSDYVNSTPEQSGSGRYILTVPGYLPAGRYFATLYVQLGGSPAAGDTPVDEDWFDWDGSNVLTQGSTVDVGKINGSAIAAANLSKSAAAMQAGVAAAGTLTTSQMTTNLTNTTPDAYKGRVLQFTSGNNAGIIALITAYAVTGGKLTFICYGNSPLPSAPVASDTFVIV